MINLVDPVQRNIHAIVVRDAIVPDDASDMALVNPSPKQIQRQLRAMLAGVDFVGDPAQAALDDPPGRRVGRVAFNAPVRALWQDDSWTGAGPPPHRLPQNHDAICKFIIQRTHIGSGAEHDREEGPQVERLLGFSIEDHARNSDILRANGPASRLFVAISILSAACATYEKARVRNKATGRSAEAVNAAVLSVEAALHGAARITAQNFLAGDEPLPHIGRIAMYLARQTEMVRYVRSQGNFPRAVRAASVAADTVQIYLTRSAVRQIPLEGDREPKRLMDRLLVANAALEAAVQAVMGDVYGVDCHDLYILLMALRLDVALARHPWLAAPHPIFRLSYAYVGGHALFAELERLSAIVTTMKDRESLDDCTILNSVTIRPTLDTAVATHDAIDLQTAAGRYLDLGAYHRAVTTSFMRNKARLMSATVPSYTHHAYAKGSRFCDLAAAATDVSTHRFIRNSEFDKPTQQQLRPQNLVLFYGLAIEETVILALRQMLARLTRREGNTDDWRLAFGRTVHQILQGTVPKIAARLETSSNLTELFPDCKGLSNRATELVRRFDDRDYDGPSGIRFDYALWFDRDRDSAFWDRLQKGAKLHGGFGSAFIAAPTPAEQEALPGRQGRRATPTGAPPSRWRLTMLEAKQAFETYRPLYLKSRPSRLTARIMARMNHGYSSFASDPEFRKLFKT